MLSGDPRRAGLEHVHGRQVAPVPGRRDEPGLHRGATGRRAAASSAGTDSWAPRRTNGIPDLVYDNHPVDQPATPEEGYHLTEDITDKAIEFIKDAKVLAPEKPFFLYYAPGAAHAPHHAPKEWIDRYKGQFDMGYEAMRDQTLARQKEMGIVPPDTELPPLNPIGTSETRTGPERRAVPRTGRHAALGLAVRRGAAAVRADGRGLRRLPRRTPIATSGGCSTTWRRPASARTRWSIVVSDNGASAARAARTARSTR